MLMFHRGNQLLSGKIREIVAFGNQKQFQDDRAIRNALRIACAEEFVMALEKVWTLYWVREVRDFQRVRCRELRLQGQFF